ncbi:MAG: flippase-like domain-containing protein [Nitrospiraceae bacterium]
MLRLILLLLGLLTLIALVWHVGPARIVDAAVGLGPVALVVILLPSVLMYALETFGWRLTLGRYARTVWFGRLLAIRTAGEVVNMTTPTAYVGGEPLKAYLLKRHGVPLVDGLASVILAKTIMTVAQIVFVIVGIGFAFWTIQPGTVSNEIGRSRQVQVVAAMVSAGLLLFGIVIFLTVQRRGLFTSLVSLLRRCGIRLHSLESREEKLRALDRTIIDFYSRARLAFLCSTGVFLLGWLAEALEVYAILYYVGPPADIPTSIAIGALAVLIKGGTFFIPGSIGAQEGGNLLLLMAFGYSDLAGITFAILRRLRELVWIAIGLACMAAMGGFGERGDGLEPAGRRPSAYAGQPEDRRA